MSPPVPRFFIMLVSLKYRGSGGLGLNSDRLEAEIFDLYNGLGKILEGPEAEILFFFEF